MIARRWFDRDIICTLLRHHKNLQRHNTFKNSNDISDMIFIVQMYICIICITGVLSGYTIFIHYTGQYVNIFIYIFYVKVVNQSWK